MLLTVHLALAKWSGTLDRCTAHSHLALYEYPATPISSLTRKFECELCDRSFSEKWALNNHMKLHSGEKPYKCAWPSCHYAFLNLSAMKDHYRTHTGEKSYLCDLCGFAGGTRHALTKHRRQHTGERPFKCKLCSFASTTQSHLSRHKRVHTGEKPYRCPWCDYRSNCAENIRKHILHTGKHEGVKMYNCPKCIHATNSPMEFRNHLKESHTDIENPDLAYLHADQLADPTTLPRLYHSTEVRSSRILELVFCQCFEPCYSMLMEGTQTQRGSTRRLPVQPSLPLTQATETDEILVAPGPAARSKSSVMAIPAVPPLKDTDQTHTSLLQPLAPD
ncbi:hypothetical protein NQZ68_013331 [Dissostichus eleginoides]|nr:hypothetical protein NQZ68_013331 [Dissostichus eleginoides]